jgi:hypothetical protein
MVHFFFFPVSLVDLNLSLSLLRPPLLLLGERKKERAPRVSLSPLSLSLFFFFFFFLSIAPDANEESMNARGGRFWEKKSTVHTNSSSSRFRE